MSRSVEGTSVPRVSVIMSNYKGGRFLAPAIESVLAQSIVDLELIVVDDCSGNKDSALVEIYRERDDRVRLIALETNVGPAGARNRGIDAARGEWLAIVDNDDLIHPERLRVLLEAADQDDADIVADDLLTFFEDSPRIETMLPETLNQPYWVSLPDFIRSNAIYGPSRPLGYCKPIFRRKALGDFRYDETLRIGEDANLLVRLLAAGRRFRIYPWLLYSYRKHSGSISYRFNHADSQRLISAQRGLLKAHAALGPDIVSAHAAVLRSLERAAAFASLIDGLKTRSPARIINSVRESPEALLLLRMPLRAWFERQRRRLSRRRQIAPSFLQLRCVDKKSDESSSTTGLRRFARLFEDKGYTIKKRVLSSNASDWYLLRRDICLELARHGRVPANVLLIEPPLGPAALPYILDAPSVTLVLGANGIRVHRHGGAIGTQSLAMPNTAARGRPAAEMRANGRERYVSIAGARNAAEIAGLEWFLSAVWPRVRELYPDAMLQIEGGLAGLRSALPAGVSRATAGTGRRAEAGIVVFPRRVLSSDASAILEAMQRGKAVVMTPAAWESLPMSKQPGVCVAYTAPAMADRIAEFLAEPTLGAELDGDGFGVSRSLVTDIFQQDPLTEVLVLIGQLHFPAGILTSVALNMPSAPVNKRL